MTAQEFKAIRKRMGLTQRALATRLGYSTQQVSNYERGESEVSKVVEELMLCWVRDMEGRDDKGRD